MAKAELEPVRTMLVQLEWRLRGGIDGLTKEVSSRTEMQFGGNLSNGPGEDRATGGFDDDVTIGLLKCDSARLGEITAALDRIAGGTYGRCEVCARAIARNRLRIIPCTRLCIACASRGRQG